MAGISILRRLLMKEAVIKNAPFQNEGIMSISKALATNVDSKVNKIVEGAKKQGIDFDKYNEEQIKYILELNKKKLEPRVISADSPEGRGITEALLGRKEGKVIKRDFGKPFAEEMVTPVERVITDIKKLEPIEAMKEANKVLKGEGRYKNLSQADRKKIVNDESVTDHIFERQKPRDADDPNYDAEPADFDPDADNETFAIGGRVGLKTGMSKRAFLKLMGGAAAGIGALKAGALKMFGKEGAKNIPQVVTTPPAPGKPAWFDSLVNKVIAEGDDVTKQFAVKDRELVNTKQINDFSEVTVYRDLDTNTVRVNYGSTLRKDPTKPYERGNIQRAVNDPDQVDLIVKGPEDIEPTFITNREGFVQRRGTKTNAEFEAFESEPRVANFDGDIEFDGERVVNNVDDLMEDISPLEEYATGKKLTGEKAAKAQKKREDYERFTQDPIEQADYLENKYGPARDTDDFASGGIARLLGE